jgi:MFS family permease
MSIDADTSPARDKVEAGVTHRGAALSLSAASGATMLALTNYTAPNTTLPAMAADLGAGAGAQAWILGGIAVGLAAVLLVAGGLADAYGRRRVFVAGASVLAVALVVGALATSAGLFVAARIVQGAASAALIAAGLGMVAYAYPPGPARVRAIGIWGAMLSAGLLLGPIVSAALAAPLDWRAAYWLFAVVAVVLVVVALIGVPESRADRRRRIDVPGVTTFGLGIAALMVALTASRDGWLRAEVLVPLALSALLLGGFVLVEAHSREPLLELGLFRRRLFLASTIGALLTGLSIIGVIAFLPAVLQRAVGQSPLTSALVVGIWAGASFLSALQARRLRFPATHQLAASFALSAIGFAALLGVVGDWSWPQASAGLAVAGIGSGIGNAALARLAVESVPLDRAGLGSGANNGARYVGAALGVAIVVTIVTSAPDGIASGTDRALAAAVAVAALGAVVALALGRPVVSPAPVPRH